MYLNNLRVKMGSNNFLLGLRTLMNSAIVDFVNFDNSLQFLETQKFPIFIHYLENTFSVVLRTPYAKDESYSSILSTFSNKVTDMCDLQRFLILLYL